ncbi:MAG TPA: DUF1800 domain-containing protein [Chthoniobacterales bacterium]|nr:DUF1800 domain-containing protein [Chthoniobacterales bacterium]
MLTPLDKSKWNEANAAHLLNRAGFGATPVEIERARQNGLAATVRDFVEVKADAASVPPPAWAHPRNIRAQRMEIKAAKDRGENFRTKIRDVRMMEGDEMIDLRRWWLDRMLNGPAPLLEKMTLFWHGHFATSIQKVRDAYWMWLQNDTLRRNALGNFSGLVKKISRDPAMMIYLDLQQSRQEHPNENWARELMELFTVGIGNYTEQDIRESARAFTGYRIDFTTQQFRFAPFQQDHGQKKFMGRTGNLSGDDIIDTLVSRPACAQFIGRKLWRFFADDDPPAPIVDSVAATIRKHNFEIRPVLRDIFSSAEFYSDRARGSQIKSPVQYIVQTSKMLDAPAPPPLAAQNAMRQMGQILFAPPNVKGWDGGKQWISTSTLLFRYNFANYLINGDAILPANVRQPRQGADVGFGRAAQYAEQIKREPIDVAKLIPADLRTKPREIVGVLAKRLFQTAPAQKELDVFAEFLESRGPDPTDANLRELIHLMMSTPQFQLA